MRKSQGVGSDFTRKLSKKRKLLGPHVFGARLKTTQKWDDLGQVGIDNAMFDPTYVVQNTESENKNDKVGYGILFHMIKLESDSEKD